ncbi:hypothetical protein ABZV75_36550 [Streptomyces flaveolus]|uniref:hypothetical protein n=1 Tax=Streptomyces flaveolus TaxID=67297 RepID=UPI0033A68AD1
MPRKKLDSVWQIQVGDPLDDTVPAQRHVVNNLVTLVAGTGRGGVVAETGHIQFASDRMENTWQVATDGKRLIRLVQADGSENNAAKPGGFPLLLASVDLLTGKAVDPFAEFTDYNGVLSENQLVCTADGVAYVAAGRGKFSIKGFLASQSWSLFAVDVSFGQAAVDQTATRAAPGLRAPLLPQCCGGRTSARDSSGGERRHRASRRARHPDGGRPLGTAARRSRTGPCAAATGRRRRPSVRGERAAVSSAAQ